jgi:hypothetical protein
MIVMRTKVLRLREEIRIKAGRKNPETGDAEFATESLGWYLLLEGFRESWYMGEARPDFEEGQQVILRIEPEEGGGASGRGPGP